MPRISTTAWRGQGWSVLLPTWHIPSFFVASVFSKSFTTTVRILGVGNAGAARSTTPNDAAGTDSLGHLLSRSSLGNCCFYYNHSTVLLLVLLSALLGGATHLPRKGPEPLLKDPSPYKVATSYLVCSSMLSGALLGRSRTLAIVKEDGVEKRPIGLSRLLYETPSEIPTCSLSPSGLFDLFSPSLQEVIMLLLGYSACLLIVQYGALLTRASGRATRRHPTAPSGGMSPLP